MKQLICLNEHDNVAVAVTPLECGNFYSVGKRTLEVHEDIERGHKVALEPIAIDEPVVKYGQLIGTAIAKIKSGTHVHFHNVKTNLTAELQYTFEPKNLNLTLKADDSPEVQIYRRSNGEVAIRNELWIIPTVGCVNGMASMMVDEFMRRNAPLDIDGIYVFPHQFGCSQLGDDLKTTRILLQNMVKHPNAGGALVLGLGCENNQISAFKQSLGSFDEDRTRFLVCQSVADEVETGVNLLEELYEQMRCDHREAGRLSEVNFGLECGGSDGLSGVTANPLLGRASDYLIERGGTTVLTEVPEMFGAEQLLMKRCRDQETFEALVAMINGFKRYYSDNNQPIYENPSPGNKMGGITTLEDKSLGCTQKAGTSRVEAILDYGDRIDCAGLNLLNAPGNDAIATSALAACGCHMILFTTGRGTPYGGFVPTMKISTNSALSERKKHWIDFDAGRLLSDASMDELLVEFLDLLARTCSGEPVKNEINNIREMAIWKKGVTL